MIASSEFYGSARHTDFGVNVTLPQGERRVVTMSATAVDLTVTLPAANGVVLRRRRGGPVFYVINVGANAFTLRNSDGTLSVVLSPNQAVIALLVDASTAAGTWRGRVSLIT